MPLREKPSQAASGFRHLYRSFALEPARRKLVVLHGKTRYQNKAFGIMILFQK